MEKMNMFVGRLQPMTQGHLNCINEGDGPCIVYRINSSGKIPETLKGFKVGGRVIKADSVKTVANYIDNPEGDLTTQEKELLKRPFTNELIEKELEIVKKNNKNIIDVIPVINMFDALIQFNKFMTDNADQYEPQFLMCGDDRADAYAENIDKYDELDDAWQSGKKIPNLLKGKLKVNIGKGRTEGVSGTDVRKAILNKDKSAFEKIMPKGVGKMFDEFVEAFDKFKGQLQGLIKENKEFKNYINNNMKSINKYIYESQDKYFTEQEKGDILRDMWAKDGQFYKFVKDKVDSLKAADINDYFDQCLDDKRCTAEFAEYIAMIINRHNFNLEQVRKFISTEDLKG